MLISKYLVSMEFPYPFLSEIREWLSPKNLFCLALTNRFHKECLVKDRCIKCQEKGFFCYKRKDGMCINRVSYVELNIIDGERLMYSDKNECIQISNKREYGKGISKSIIRITTAYETSIEQCQSCQNYFVDFNPGVFKWCPYCNNISPNSSKNYINELKKCMGCRKHIDSSIKIRIRAMIGDDYVFEISFPYCDKCSHKYFHYAVQTYKSIYRCKKCYGFTIGDFRQDHNMAIRDYELSIIENDISDDLYYLDISYDDELLYSGPMEEDGEIYNPVYEEVSYITRGYWLCKICSHCRLYTGKCPCGKDIVESYLGIEDYYNDQKSCSECQPCRCLNCGNDIENNRNLCDDCDGYLFE